MAQPKLTMKSLKTDMDSLTASINAIAKSLGAETSKVSTKNVGPKKIKVQHLEPEQTERVTLGNNTSITISKFGSLAIATDGYGKGRPVYLPLQAMTALIDSWDEVISVIKKCAGQAEIRDEQIAANVETTINSL